VAPYGLVVTFTLVPGVEAGIDELVAETLPLIREREPGTLTYNVHALQGRPDQRVFYELYADEAAFHAHEEQPHVKRFLAERAAFLDTFTVAFLDLTAAKDLPGPGDAA
jgi:quinol monooxygenase YgiN